MKKMYSTKMINTGGRSGEVHSPDHSFELNIAAPGKRVDDATNPEQLFAAGFSACFNSALDLIKTQKNIDGASTISAQVSLYAESEMSFVLGVEIEGSVEGLSIEETQELLEAAHKVCPYSKATAGNIEVTLTAVEN
ncbi:MULTISPECIES: organic hydroperoxide resistance protein [Enterococcus]|uniref:Organic hydroperoxide resistance protein n=1 Tax=Enterococcus mundtii TaxID=53346 RepID=A0A2S7RS82_ENTMU|nr:organic hydroperoxide resistance protein [Enterococcus mundtii]MDA9461961.1 Organic hydroperoxide resistance protein [Enterococcus mundtii 3F]OBS63025.1 organic hydroperoxide resistance protein [Enterococcus mundtii]PQF22475.1 organic hydroperoxide resistance protein [Enterococcus mundtii]PTO39479.1 organic hydroperoxide resistance protein [Enterococcus mundtii]PTO44417.1 organic hydroperoxide resistance protein [Enterococcus mundtii]